MVVEIQPINVGDGGVVEIENVRDHVALTINERLQGAKL